MTVEEYMSLPLNTDILIKYSYKDEQLNKLPGGDGYYIVTKQSELPDHYGRYTLVEADGEQYGTWDIKDVDDWVYYSELDGFFEERKHRREGNAIEGPLAAHKYATNMANEAHKQRLKEIKEKIELQKYSHCFDDNDMFVYRKGLDDALEIIKDTEKSKDEENLTLD